MIKIEKGIAIPKSKVGRKEIYPINDMQVGDSFFVSATKDTIRKTHQKMSAICITRTKMKNKIMKFSVRAQDDPCGVRVWRIE